MSTIELIELKGTKASIRIFKSIPDGSRIEAHGLNLDGESDGFFVGSYTTEILKESNITRNEFATKITEAAEGRELKAMEHANALYALIILTAQK
jgi:hypothetical protein